MKATVVVECHARSLAQASSPKNFTAEQQKYVDALLMSTATDAAAEALKKSLAPPQ